LPSGGLAYTTFCLESGGDNLRAFPIKSGSASRVKFVLTVRTTSGTDAITVRRLVAHEFGHVLGIAQHSLNPVHLMYAGTLSRDEPHAADRATLQVLYHTDADITP
jgi:predicted Zn-dependent protease